MTDNEVLYPSLVDTNVYLVETMGRLMNVNWTEIATEIGGMQELEGYASPFRTCGMVPTTHGLWHPSTSAEKSSVWSKKQTRSLGFLKLPSLVAGSFPVKTCVSLPSDQMS